MNYNNNLVTWAQPCDSCGAASGSVYCRADAAFLCATCDARVHVANRVASRHERVPVCDACERAPAVVACRADAADLCAECDVSIHSANRLAGRHQRVPILPLPSFFSKNNTNDGITNIVKENNEEDNKGMILYGGGEVNDYLDLAELNSCYENLGDCNQEEMMMMMQEMNKGKEGNECIVPSHVMAAASTAAATGEASTGMMMMQEMNNMKEGNECIVPSHVMVASAAATGEASTVSHRYAAPRRHSVSFSSLEAGVVPDTTTTEISNSHLDLFAGPTLQMNLNFGAVIDREARVMRYKEKKKARKFEKTIRYASRKAYADSRPRIKGRFVKRSDIELEMFSPSDLWDGGIYETMPWF